MITLQAIGYEAVKPDTHLSLHFYLMAVMLAALYTSATCFNDIADEDVDSVNLANDASRPLVTTNVTARQLKVLGIIALCVAGLSAVIVSPAYLLLVVAGIILSVLYSLPPVQLSHRGILASLWLPISYVGLPFLAGGLIQGTINRHSLVICIVMYACFTGRIFLKDFRDYEGDKQFGKLNFLVRHGPIKTCLASAIAWLIGDSLFCAFLSKGYPVVTILLQPILLAVFYGLYKLAYEDQYDRLLLEVLFVGRLGNAIALALLAALTLNAQDYSSQQKHLTVLAVGTFMACSAVGLWRDSALKAELALK
jgi:4-hydroxybenzoate polyprenyltransferase